MHLFIWTTWIYSYKAVVFHRRGKVYPVTIKLDPGRGILWLWCAWFLLLVEQIDFELSQRSCWENLKQKDLKQLNKKDSHKCFSNLIGSLEWIRNVVFFYHFGRHCQITQVQVLTISSDGFFKLKFFEQESLTWPLLGTVKRVNYM